MQWFQFVLKKRTALKFRCKTMNSVLLVYRDWVWLAFCRQQNSFFSAPNDILWNKIAALQFQKQETKKKLISEWCFETTDMNQWVRNQNKLVNQSSIVHYNHKIFPKKDVIENSVEHAVAYDKLFFGEFSSVELVDSCGPKQKYSIEQTSFQEYDVKNFTLVFSSGKSRVQNLSCVISSSSTN